MAFWVKYPLLKFLGTPMSLASRTMSIIRIREPHFWKKKKTEKSLSFCIFTDFVNRQGPRTDYDSGPNAVLWMAVGDPWTMVITLPEKKLYYLFRQLILFFPFLQTKSTKCPSECVRLELFFDNFEFLPFLILWNDVWDNNSNQTT